MLKPLVITESLHRYVIENSVHENEVMARLRNENLHHPLPDMPISPEQGQLLQLLTRAMGFRRTIEVGVFTGYSSLSVALAMPPEGRVLACDVNEEWTTTARRYWNEAGVAHKIDLRLGPALATLDELIRAGESGRFDFAFIDADKANYLNYYERAVALVRPGGLIGIDNTLWYGKVVDETQQDPDTKAVRALNRRVYEDNRVFAAMIPISDGFTLALKK
jgi:predicted O-methyltransferase YrrM